MYGLYQIGGVTVPSFTIITLSFEGYVYVTHNRDKGGRNLRSDWRSSNTS